MRIKGVDVLEGEILDLLRRNQPGVNFVIVAVVTTVFDRDGDKHIIFRNISFLRGFGLLAHRSGSLCYALACTSKFNPGFRQSDPGIGLL